MNKKKVPIIVSLILFGLIVATVFFAIKSGTQGSSLIALENKVAQLTASNQELKSEIIGATSLSTVAKAASDLKMEKPEKFVYLTHEGVALR